VDEIEKLAAGRDHLSVSTMNVRSDRHPMMLPHLVRAELWLSYLDPKSADRIQLEAAELLKDAPYDAELVALGDRPPKRKRDVDTRLAKELKAVAHQWKIPLKVESSTWPSVAGLAPPKVACVCGLGPVTREPGTPHEAVQRISLIQRTLLLAAFLAGQPAK
jgi:D-alanine-D-alanine ligase